MYKDKDRQRQAVKEATRRYRTKLRGITPDTVIYCDTQSKATPLVIPEQTPVVMPYEAEPQSHSPMLAGYVPPKQ